MPLTMGYHNRNDIPFYYALADAFTICDQHFCSSLTGTNPNRLYFWTGTIRPEQNENSRAHVWNEDMDYGTLNWSTFPERLEDNGISWKCYQNEMSINVGFEGEQDPWLSNFQDNPLEFFGQYNIHLHQKHIDHLNRQQPILANEIAELKKQLTANADPKFKEHLQQKENELKNIEAKLQKINSKHFEQLTQREKNLHQKAFTVNRNDPHYHELTKLTYDDNGTSRELEVPKGDVLHQFREDVKTGKLPTVSWLSSPENFSDHPSAPWYGAWYVSEVLDILTQDPEVWKKTIFIITYDENDGYFDHVPPFVAPHSHKSGTGKVSAGIDTRVEYVTLDQENARNGFPEKYDRECAIGLGFRVPMIIASPWSKGGFVNSEVCDHTSTLQFLEKFLSHKTGKQIIEPNISEWRRIVCGDLTSVFRTDTSITAPLPTPVAKNAFIESIHKAKFKNLPANFTALSAQQIELIKQQPRRSIHLPQQEKGVRPACALPYQLYADGKLNADRSAFEIKLQSSNELFGKSTAGAPFLIYAPGKYKSLNNNNAHENMRNWAYAVKPGDALFDQWAIDDFEDKKYHLKLYGPNGFYREFKGDANDPMIEVVFEYERNKIYKKALTGNLRLSIHSHANTAHTVIFNDNAYKTAGNKQLLAPAGLAIFNINLDRSLGWYDFSIKIAGNSLFAKTYAGHIETGAQGYSDPYMGNII